MVFGQKPKPAQLQKLRIPQTAVGTMFPIVYGDALPGQTLSRENPAGVRGAGVWIDCSPEGGITTSGGGGGGGTGGAPEAPEEAKQYLTGGIAFADARNGLITFDFVFVNEKCQYDRYGATSKKRGPYAKGLEEVLDIHGNVIAEIGAKMEMYRGSWHQSPSPILQAQHAKGHGDGATGIVPAYRGIAYIVFNDIRIKTGIPTITAVARDESSNVRVMVYRHLRLGKMPHERIDLCHTDEFYLRGAYQNNVGAARDLAEQLASYAHCDLAEWDAVIKDVSRRDAGIAVEVSRRHLGARVSGGQSNNSSTRPDGVISSLKQTVTPDDTLPSSHTIKFSDIKRNWDGNEALATRQLATHYNPVSEEVGLVGAMEDFVPRARIRLDEAWTQRTPFSIALPFDYLRCAPGGLIDIPVPDPDNANDDTKRFVGRISKQKLGDVLSVEGTSYDTSIYENQPGYAEDEGVGGNGDGIKIVEVPRVLLLDPVALTDDEATSTGGRFLAATCRGTSTGSVWRGAQLLWNPTPSILPTTGVLSLLGLGGGTNETTIFEREAVMGETTTALSVLSRADFDYTATLGVKLYAGELGAASEDYVLRGANRALLQDSRGAGIDGILGGNGNGFNKNGARLIQWTHCEQVDDDEYLLSGLLAGRFATEYIEYSPAGTKFLLLFDESGQPAPGVVSIEVPRLRMNRSQSYIALAGENDERSERVAITCSGNSLRTRAPLLRNSSRAANGDLTLAWVPRATLPSAGLSYWTTDTPPLSPPVNNYLVTLYKFVNGVPTIVHQESVLDTRSVTFTLTELEGFYGTPHPAVSGLIAQYSAPTGNTTESNTLSTTRGFSLHFKNV